MRKNIRKIPNSILAKIKVIKADEFVVGCVKKYTFREIVDGRLKKYGIEGKKDGSIADTGTPVVPLKQNGKYSFVNVCGDELTLYDQPKVMRDIPYHVKDWHGVWHSGTYQRPCYPRVYVSPKNIAIVAKVNECIGDEVFVSFCLSETMKKSAKDFQDQVLFGLNLMWENVLSYGIENAATPMNEFEHVISVNWKIFPVGTQLPGEFARIVARGRTPAELAENVRLIEARYRFLVGLGAKTMIQGFESFGGYIGAQLDDGIVVFDKIKYGNAAYVVQGPWEELSKMPRLVLRKKYGDRVIPVPHHGDWRGGIARAVSSFKA